MAVSVEIQSTHQIISLFEASKEQRENELDNFPGIHVVLDNDGSIFRCNRNLGNLLNVGFEKALKMDFKKCFSSDQWKTFRLNMDQLNAESVVKTEFAADVTDGTRVFKYHWHLKKIRSPSPEFPVLFSAIGRDVTELTQATRKNERMQMELATARAVQSMLLPSSPYRFQNSIIVGHYESATECGGDWWNYSFLDGKLFLWIGDVTGHGVHAALVTSAVCSAVSILGDMPLTPASALGILNRAIVLTTKGSKLMTFLVVSVDLQTGKVTYSSASHEPMLLLPAQAKNPAEIQACPTKATLPLGERIDYDYPEFSLQMNRGDRLFLYTDGLYELMDRATKSRNGGSLRRILARLGALDRGCEEFMESLKQQASVYRDQVGLDDDLTCLIFQY